MNHPLIALFLCLSINLFGQNEKPIALGIGFAIATDPFQYEDGKTPTNIFKSEKLTENFGGKVVPFFYKPDYALYHFICLEKTKTYYKILANNGTIAYLPNNSNYYFKSWDAMLVRSTVERLTDNNPIRKEMDSKSDLLEHNCKFDRLTVQDVVQQGDDFWLQIYFSTRCEDFPAENSNIKYGWIKWRTYKELLINILLLC